jgi:hypothetical protein
MRAAVQLAHIRPKTCKINECAVIRDRGSAVARTWEHGCCWLNTIDGSPLQTATIDPEKASLKMVTQIMRKVYFAIPIAASAFERESRAYHPKISS